MFLVQIVGCGAVGPTKPNAAEETSVEQNATALRAVYVDQLDYLLKRSVPLDDRDAVVRTTLDYYAGRFGRNSAQYDAIAAAAIRDPQSLVSVQTQSVVPESLRGLVQRVDLAVQTSATLPQFLESLGRLQHEVLAGSRVDEDKQQAMSYLILLQESMRALGQARADGMTLQELGGESFSFWRCAAGVIGGAVAGGLVGASASC